MTVLVACEFSGIVRDALLAEGVDAVSCDISPSERPGPHIQADIANIDLSPFTAILAFPPCTRLCNAGNRWRALYPQQTEAAIRFFLWIAGLPHAHIVIENPVGIMSTEYRKPDQIIQPWQYGHGETKATCLWLKGLPCLVPTDIVEGREPRIHHMPGGKNQSKNRSRTYPGIAQAMARQWKAYLKED